MRHLPHHQGAVVAALLAGGVGAADTAAAGPKDKDPNSAKARHNDKHNDRYSHKHATSDAPGTPSTARAKPQKHQRRAAPALATAGPTAVALPPATAPIRAAVAPQAALRPQPRAGAPFQRTARPFRPLVRPTAVPEATVLWQVREPAERPLLRALRTTAEDPTTPLLVAALVGLFLLVQHRIDRDDPKLSRGHRNDPPDLRFGPVMAL